MKLTIYPQAVVRIPKIPFEKDLESCWQELKALGVSVETIKNFNEDAIINYIQNNYDGSNKQGVLSITNDNCIFNPIEKIVELYDALLKSEREKTEIYKHLHENATK